MRQEFSNLKQDSVLEVFRTAVSGSNLTRAEIAEKCGLSVMTVGKAVDALVTLKILKQSMSADSRHGRRSRTVAASPELWTAVYIVGERGYSFYMTDLSLRTIDVMQYALRGNIFVDDEFNGFVRRAAAFAKERRRIDRCCGTAVLVPAATYHSISAAAGQEIGESNAPPRLLEGDSAFRCRPVWGITRDYHARRAQALAVDKNVFCVYINTGDIKAVYSGAGTSGNRQFSNAGLFIGNNSSMSLNDMTMTAADPELFCETLAEYLCVSVLCVPCDLILLSGDRPKHLDAVRDVTCAIFDEYCMKLGVIPPEVRCERIRDGAAAAAAQELRDSWFRDKMLNG